MNEDSWLFGIVFAVWLALAIVYAAVPMFSMPGYAVVWGWGALVFLGLAALVAVAARRGRNPPTAETASSTRAPGRSP